MKECSFCDRLQPVNISKSSMWLSAEYRYPSLAFTVNHCPDHIDCYTRKTKYIDRFIIKFCPMCGKELKNNERSNEHI